MISGPCSDSPLELPHYTPQPRAQKPKQGIDTPQTSLRETVWVCTFCSFSPSCVNLLVLDAPRCWDLIIHSFAHAWVHAFSVRVYTPGGHCPTVPNRTDTASDVKHFPTRENKKDNDQNKDKELACRSLRSPEQEPAQGEGPGEGSPGTMGPDFPFLEHSLNRAFS